MSEDGTDQGASGTPLVDISLVPKNPIIEDYSMEIMSQILNEIPLNYIDKVINSVCLSADQTLLEVLNSHKKRLGLEEDDFEQGISVMGQRLSDELSYQFDKLELYARNSVFSFPDKLAKYVKDQNIQALSGYSDVNKSLSEKIRDTQLRIVAMKKLETSLVSQVRRMKARLEIAQFQNRAVLKILPEAQDLVGSEQGVPLCKNFNKLLGLLEKSISHSDNLDSKLLNTPIYRLIEQRDQMSRYYIQNILKFAEGSLLNLLKIHSNSDQKTDSELDMEPLNEFETFRYSSEYLRLTRSRKLGALKCWEDIL